MNLSKLESTNGARKTRKRVGRGPGSGHGKTSCKGHKGQKARSGKKIKPGFEGGQMPLLRRLPKFGFTNIHKIQVEVLNLGDLEKFESGSKIDHNSLLELGMISRSAKQVKVLGSGTLTKKLDLHLTSISKSALEAVVKAGGSFQKVD